jgi:hypothetical protein
VRRFSAVSGFARVAIGAIVVGSLVVACRPKDRGPAAELPGTLTKPIGEYSGDEFYALTHKLEWGGGAESDRKCVGDPQCEGATPSKYTLVRVDAVGGQDSISATNLPKNGVVTVRALNRGEYTEARYGFKNSKTLEYYVLVLPGDEKAGRWQVAELDTTTGARKITMLGSGTFTPCNHPYQPKLVNRANFYTCQDAHMSDSVQKTGLLLFSAHDDPIWASCAQGCCIMN